MLETKPQELCSWQDLVAGTRFIVEHMLFARLQKQNVEQGLAPSRSQLVERALANIPLLAPEDVTGEDLAEGASFWHAFLTPFWGPETIVIFKRNYVEAMCGLSQIQDKPSKSFDQNQPDITFGKRSSPKHKRP